MKKTTIILLLLIGAFTVNAQDTINSGIFRFGLNGAFYGSGDLIGPSIYGEYSHPINSCLAVVPKVFCGIASHKEENKQFFSKEFHQNSSFGASLAASITPMPQLFNRLRLDVGVLYHYMAVSYNQKSYSNIILEGSDTLIVLPAYRMNLNSYSDHMFGLTGSLSFDIIQTTRTISGIRFDMLTSFYKGSLECDSMQLGVFLGVKL